MKNLQSIFNSIMPENLKNVPVIADSSEIFIELLQELSFVSINCEHFFNSKMSELTKEELIKIYFYDYSSMIEKLLSDYYIITRFRKENQLLRPALYADEEDLVKISDNIIYNYFKIGEYAISSNYSDPKFDSTLKKEIDINPIYNKIFKLKKNLLAVTPENFYFNRIFKETKGFYSSIEYLYDVINKALVPEDERVDISISDVSWNGNIGDYGLSINDEPLNYVSSRDQIRPFYMNIKGSLQKDIYRNSVRYLSHPLGFVYNYLQVRRISFDDNFMFFKKYVNAVVQVRCLNGLFEDYNLSVKDVIKFNNSTKIVFDDLSYLSQDENNYIKYFSSNGNIIKEYPISNNCAIYFSYELQYVSKIKDSINFKFTQTFDSENVVSIMDKLSQVITFNENAGLIIGKFYFGNDVFFTRYKESYDFKPVDAEFDVRNSTHLTVKEIYSLLDETSFEEKANLKISSYNFNTIDSIDNIEISFNNSDKIIISDDNKIEISINSDDSYSADEILDKIKFVIPINEIDKAEIDEIILQNDTSSNISEKLSFDEVSLNVLSTKLTDNMLYADIIRSYSKIKLDDKINISDNTSLFSSNKVNDEILINETNKTLTSFRSLENNLDMFNNIRESTEKIKLTFVLSDEINILENINTKENINFSQVNAIDSSIDTFYISDMDRINPSVDMFKISCGYILDLNDNVDISDNSTIRLSNQIINITDNINMLDSNNFESTTTFKNGYTDLLGEFMVGETNIINDYDVSINYKYNDTMSIE